MSHVAQNMGQCLAIVHPVNVWFYELTELFDPLYNYHVRKKDSHRTQLVCLYE
jgi:hypothetical protein